MARDAQWAHPPAWARRVTPRHVHIWVRLAGRWYWGAIHSWIDLGEGTWLIWCQHDDPAGSPWSVWAAYTYDPEAIRPNHGGDPPDD